MNNKTIITIQKELLSSKLSELINIFNAHPCISNQWQILKKSNKSTIYFEFDNNTTTIQAKRIINLIIK